MTRLAPTIARDVRVARPWLALAGGHMAIGALMGLGKRFSGNAPAPI